MKYPMFASMGKSYPIHLETQHERILKKIEKLWRSPPQLHDYFSDLLIDKRGGRKGFPAEVMQDIMALREHHELQTFQAAERKEDAARQLEQRAIPLTAESFLKEFRAGNQENIDLFVRAQFKFPQTDDGEPVILAALKRGHTVIAKIVMGAGADVNLRNRLGLTPLLVACAKTTTGYRSLAESLINRGAFVNVRDPLGNTPLLLAISGRMYDIAHLLLAHGANDQLTNGKGESPLDLARRTGDPAAAELVELMEQRRAATDARKDPGVEEAIRQQATQPLLP